MILFFLGAALAPTLIQATPAWGSTPRVNTPSAPTISGTPAPGQTLSCVSAPVIQPPGTVISYFWTINGAPGSPSSSNTLPLTAGNAGDQITCTIEATLGSVSANATSSTVYVPGPPADLTPPYITQNGTTLTCNPGGWTGSPSGYTYSWLEGTPPTQLGATSATYTVSTADVGQEFICTVGASNGSGASQVTVPSAPYYVTGLTAGSSGSSGGSSGGSGGGAGSGGGGGSAGGSGGSGSTTHPTIAVPNITIFTAARRLVLHVKRGHVTSAGLTLHYGIDRGASGGVVVLRRTATGKYVTVTVLTFKDVAAGAHQVRLKPAVARRLTPGKYLAVIAAADAGGWSSAHYRSFTVVRHVVRVHHRSKSHKSKSHTRR